MRQSLERALSGLTSDVSADAGYFDGGGYDAGGYGSLQLLCRLFHILGFRM